MFTFSKQLVSVNIQQMPKFTIIHRNAVFVWSVWQCGRSQPFSASLSLLSLLSAHSVPWTSFIINTDNTLLHIILDFSTIKRGLCANMERCEVFKSACVCEQVSLSFTWKFLEGTWVSCKCRCPYLFSCLCLNVVECVLVLVCLWVFVGSQRDIWGGWPLGAPILDE